MTYYFPFGQELHPLVQKDTSPKKVFVLGVYASAVHARWKKDGQIICQALAVASEPRIFWDGNPEEAKQIITEIYDGSSSTANIHKTMSTTSFRA